MIIYMFVFNFVTIAGKRWSRRQTEEKLNPKPEGEIIAVNNEKYLKFQNKNGDWQAKKINARGYLE